MARNNNTVAAPIVITTNKAAITRAANKAAAEQARIEAEQQAELARLRAEKKAKREEAIRAKAAALDAANEATRKCSIKSEFTPEQEAAAQQERIMNAAAAFLGEFEMPSWKRTLAATVISLLVSFGTGYIVGLVAGALLVGAVALTGAMWLGWVIWAVGLVLAGYVGLKSGGASFSYIADKKIDAHVGSVRSTVGKWFGRGKEKAQELGAYVREVAA